LDAKLKQELIALINKKENAGVAKSLVDALRTELNNKINKIDPKLKVESRTERGKIGKYSWTNVYWDFYINGKLNQTMLFSSSSSTGNNF
ncbi:phage tail protein, partial [Campylobacter lari]|nr:phage tail protein [Campylobacter lari]